MSVKTSMNTQILQLICMALCLAAVPALSQEVKVDTMMVKHTSGETRVKADSVSSNGDIVLDEIFVEGKVSKPGVMIVPKRLEPKLKERQLQRSFQNELSNKENGVYKPKKELHKVDRVQSIKKALEKERKKEND